MSGQAAAGDSELQASVAAVLEALRSPGFRAVCVDKLLAEAAGSFVFLECPLAALVTVARLLPLTADRPPDQRFKPLLARARAVAASDAHLALGVADGGAGCAAVAALVQQTPREQGFVVLLSVVLGGSPPGSACFAATYEHGEADEPASLSRSPQLEGAPSAWAAERPAAPPAAEWLFCANRGKGRSAKRPLFQWTGRLRPFPISPYRPVPDSIPRPDYATTGWPADEYESKKQNSVHLHSPAEVEGIRTACLLGRKVLDACAAAVRPGVTTDELDRIAHEVTVAGGGYPSPLNYCSFPKSCCTSVNEVICHGIPDARPLEDGDIVNLDISVFLGGFHADLNETVLCGNVDAAGRALVKGAWDCLAAAIAIVKPGTRFRDPGDVISTKASQAGLSVVRTYCGHGIGELFHCAPNIPHYSNNKAMGVMRPGMVFTIEPMINLGGWKDTTWPDGWTSVTTDGKRSAQFEHTLLVTETGVEVLTARLPSSPPNFPFVD